MIKSFEILRPAGIPYRLLSFKFYFENVNTHILDLYHAAGMELVYFITKSCYFFPQNEVYQLLQLQNTEELHEPKYNWLLIKVIFGEAPKTKATIHIENEELLNIKQPDHNFDKEQLFPNRLPESGNDIVISDTMKDSFFYHFYCNEVLPGSIGLPPFISIIYLNTYANPHEIINLWLNEEYQLSPLS